MVFYILLQGIPDDDIEQSNQKQIILSGKYYTLFNINWKKEKKSSHLICYRCELRY